MSGNRGVFRLSVSFAAVAAFAAVLVCSERTPVHAQAAVVGQPGIIAAYGFEEGTGTTVADAAGNGHTGTTSGTDWSATGRFGKALAFNGTNSRVNIPDDDGLDLTVGMTIEAWVNPATLTGWRVVLMKESLTGLAYALYAHDSAEPAGFLNTGLATDFGVNGTTTLPVNTWSHLATTYDGTSMRLYVNGVLVATRAQTGAIAATTNPLRIGGDTRWGEYFSGLIDEVRIYGRPLSAAEIQSDMAAPISQVDFTPPTVSLISPPSGTTNVSLLPSVSAVFSEAMSTSSITSGTFELRTD